ncbi:hypothetical protein Tco_0567944 [Tanacetum coccineum]
MEGLHLALKDALHSNLFMEQRLAILVFYLASSLKINIHKSNVYGIGVSPEEVFNIARVTRCVVGSMPYTYLGLPIGSNMSRIANLKKLVDMFRSKIWLWKANLLSIEGLLTLIKAVLGSIGIYYMSIFKVSESIIKLLERFRASFFWGGNEDRKKLSWIKWVNVLDSLDKGGLGVQLVKAIHGSEGGYDEKGCNTRDTWLGDGSLNWCYNRLFRLDRNEDCCIIDRISNGEWSWDWDRHDLGGRNADSLNLLLAEIGNANVGTGEDSWHWNLSDDGMFTVGVTSITTHNFHQCNYPSIKLDAL